MQSPQGYEYLVSRIRARASRLFDRSSYRAVLGCSTPVEAVLSLNQSRFKGRLASLAPMDYEELREWLTMDFSETYQLIVNNAPLSLGPLLSGMQDVFTAIYVSHLAAKGRGSISPLGMAVAIPPNRQPDALKRDAGAERLSQAFVGDGLRAKAVELLQLTAMDGKVFRTFSLPAFAAREALFLAQSLDKSEFWGLTPLLDTVSQGSMVVASVFARLEQGDVAPLMRDVESTIGEDLLRLDTAGGMSSGDAERLCWKRTAPLARNCLIGYPFRARTVVGFLFLEWFDVANWRLAVMALQGVLTAEEADRSFIMA